jgi:hypothetical protein
MQLVAFPHPPPIHNQITHHQRMRFRCTTAGSQSVTFTNLMDTMLVATSAVQGYDLWDSVRVNFIEMWSVPTSGVTTVSVDFPGLSGVAAGDGTITSDTSVGLSPAHIKCRPSRNSAAGEYQGQNAMTAFSLLACPLDAVIDVDCTFRNSSVAPVAAAVALVGAQVGQFYYRGLDGQAIAGTKFPPIANLTI